MKLKREDKKHFETYAYDRYLVRFKDFDLPLDPRKEVLCFEGGRYYREDINELYLCWQACIKSIR